MDSIWDEEKISKARCDAELTAEVAAERLDITPEYVYMIEGGKKQRLATLKRQIVANACATCTVVVY